jgi:hypothetical protein
MSAWVLPLALLPLILSSCGGTWVDDDRNFNRVFGFGKPDDVKTIHSYYWKSPHWSVEYRYFIALRASPSFLSGLTRNMMEVSLDRRVLTSCGDKPPQWFLPKPLSNYDAWIPKDSGYYIFRDRADGTLFLSDERL